MIDSFKVKEIMLSLGADLCGIASIDSFSEAPKGYHPSDVFPVCKSVISFACRFPVGTLSCTSPIPYTRARNSITAKMDAIALDFCIEMEKYQVKCIPIPTNESLWDKNTNRWRSIVSQKHIAQAAGLGTIGRHSLLITPEFGSMVLLGSVLCDKELEPDIKMPGAKQASDSEQTFAEQHQSICSNCNLCVEACPVDALEQTEMNQEKCWEYAFGDDPEKNVWRISCHKCRDVCPHNFGTLNSF